MCLCNIFFHFHFAVYCPIFFCSFFRVRGYSINSLSCLKSQKYATLIVSIGYIEMCSIIPAEAPANIVTDSLALGRFS